MNTFWLKIAGIAVVVVIVLAVAGRFTGGDDKTASSTPPAAKSKTVTSVYDKFDEDEKRLNAPIQAKPESNEVETAQAPAETNTAPVASTPVVEAEAPKAPTFVKLTEAQRVDADRIWQMVVTERKMGRLPIMTFGHTVTYCRMLLERYPGSEYAYKAKRVLNEVVETNDRYKEQYHITDEELDMGPYQ